MTTGWQGKDAELYDEAVRFLPALAKSRLAGDLTTCSLLLDAYRLEADDRCIPHERAWLIFSTASVFWLARMFEREAAAEDLDCTDVAAQAIAAAVTWAAYGE